MAFMDYMPQFGQNTTQDQMPQDDSMMQLELQRRLKFADALRQQEAPQGQMVSGIYVAPSITQSLAGLANKYVAGKQEQNAMKQYGDYQASKSAKLGSLLEDLQKGKTMPMDYNEAGNMPGMEQTTPFSQQEYMAKVLQVMPELAPDFLKTDIANKFKQEAPVKLGANESIGTMVNGQFVPSYTNAPKPKFSDKFSNIKVDENTGKTYGINNETMQVEEIPGSILTAKPVAAPVERKRTKGLTEVQEVMIAPPSAQYPEGQWKEVGRGPRFAPEKPQADPYHFNDNPNNKLTNSKGWVLHTDAKGNKAYVSPDGKQFEEAN